MHRDAGLIFIGLLLAVVLGALLMNASNEDGAAFIPNSQVPAAVSFSVLAEGERAADITERANYRIHTETEFAALWSALHEEEDVPLPLVDFEAHDVLAVFDGLRPTGGYEISVVSVEQTSPGEITVTILHKEPGDSCLTTEVVTSPFELIVVPKADAKIAREDLTEVKECEE